MKHPSNKDGFTLVELIVVIVILGILAAIAVPALVGYIDKAQNARYIAEAREYKQTVVAMQVLVKGEDNKDLWQIGRTRDYYFEASNTNFDSSTGYKIIHITCEGKIAETPGGRLIWEELTGKPYKNRYLSDVRTSSFIGYIIVDKESNIVAGWLISEDTSRVITWGIKPKPSTTFYNSTNFVAVGGSEETLMPSDIDPSEDFRVYKREPGTKIYYPN